MRRLRSPAVSFGKTGRLIRQPLNISQRSTLGLLAPALSLTLYEAGSDWSHTLVLWLFGCLVLAVGVGEAGIDLTTKNYVLDLASNEDERPLYIGFNNTLARAAVARRGKQA